MTVLIPQEVVKPIGKGALLKEPHRILHVNHQMDEAILIPLEPRRKRKQRLYFVGYRTFSLSSLREQLSTSNPLLVVTTVQPRPQAALSDAELNAKYCRQGKTEAHPLTERKRRYAQIQSLVEAPDAFLLFDRATKEERILQHAQMIEPVADRAKRVAKCITATLNQYWAGGGCDPRALTPFKGACGGRGNPRKLKGRKLGRRNVATKANIPGVEGLQCTQEHIDIIQYCWRNYLVRNTTMPKACRKMWREFYTMLVTDDTGKTSSEFLPQHMRPTQRQFNEWGRKQNAGQEAWKKQLGHKYYERNCRPLPGSATDDVVAIGQRGAMDSTPPDMQFVSMTSRLDRIGGAYRIVIRDTMFGYIPGFYLGLHPPSSATVKLALLHAMMDKKQWLSDLGLSCPAEDWIPMAFTNILADNTDLRTIEIHRDLQAIQTNLMHVPTYRSDMNAVAESGHHIMHRLVDHTMTGSSYGRKNDRGEEPADLRARHVLMDGIRETARAVHVENTRPLDIFRSLAMREANIEPTRLAMTRYLMEQGKVARTLLDLETARSRLLPIGPGTFTESGVKLRRTDRGDQRVFIEPLRYVSHHPRILELMAQARRGRKRQENYFDAEFRQDPFRLQKIWYRDPDTLLWLELDLKVDDPALATSATLYDVLDLNDKDSLDTYFNHDVNDRKLSQLDEAQEESNRDAEAKYQTEAEKLDKPLTKVAQKANKKENREREEQLLHHGMPLFMPAGSRAEPPAPNAETVDSPPVMQATTVVPAAETPTPMLVPVVRPRNLLKQALVARKVETE